MSNFSEKPIDVTAEQLEKIASMNIDDVRIDENSDNNSLPTSKVVMETIAGETEKFLPLQAETEWVFDGGNASTEIDILYKPDDEMSNTSNNAVKNKVIKSYVDKKIIETNKKIEKNKENLSNILDFVVERGESGIWHYVKWQSGRCELYAHTFFKPTQATLTGSLYYSELFKISFPFVVGERVIVGNAGMLCLVCNMGSGGSYASTDLRLASPKEFEYSASPDGIPVNLVVYGTWK